MKRLCLHCEDPARTVCRPRGLCWRCFHTPGVRPMYGSKGPFVRRGSGLTPTNTMPEPTTAKPGTPEKKAVLTSRAEQGQHLFHPDDATY